MQADIVYDAGIMSRQSQKLEQLTIRGVPSQVKRLLVERAAREKKSLNAILLDILKDSAGVDSTAKHTDLNHLSGLWVEDAEFDAAIIEQHQIDESLCQ